jgi:predicted DNA binding protein
MKKMTVHLHFHGFFQNLVERFFPIDKIESADVIEVLKVDLEQGYKVILTKIVMKDGYTLKDLEKDGTVTILSELKQEGNAYICLMRGQPPHHVFSRFKDISKKFDVDVIWDTPTRMYKHNVVFSVIGEEESLQKVLTACKLMGEIQTISFSKSLIDSYDMLSYLTEKQREIVISAKKHGYYDYPRKITGDQLSQKMGISKSTMIEHLRKAEKRIMSQLLVGY